MTLPKIEQRITKCKCGNPITVRRWGKRWVCAMCFMKLKAKEEMKALKSRMAFGDSK